MNTDLQSTSRPVRFLLLPSISDLIFLVLLIAFSYWALGSRLLWDADIGWHIRNGQNILATHAIPRVDSFSATRAGQTWYAWEWLFDLLIAIVHNRLGLNGVVFSTGFVIALTFAMVFRISLRRGATVPITIVIFPVGLLASSIHFLSRPHVVSWAFAVVWFWILDAYERDGQGRALWLLPALMIVWVNLHGGFVLGLVLIAVFLASSVIKTFAGKAVQEQSMGRRQARNLGLTLLASALASLANPYGYKLHVHVYQYLANRFYMQHIDEFRAPDLRFVPVEFFLVLLALTVAAIFAARLRLRWSEWLLVGFSAFSGLWAARNIPIASMLLIMIVAPLFSRTAARRADSSASLSKLWKFRAMELDNLRGHVWPVFFFLAMLLVCANGGKLFGVRCMDAHFDPSRFPVRAVNAMAARHDAAPIFSLDSWGGYFIYRRYPDQKVFVDDRHDFYGEPYLRDYLAVLHVEPGWSRVLNSWGVNQVVFPAKSKLADALRRAGWRTVYQDQTSAVFQR